MYRYQTYPSSWATCFYASTCVYVSSVCCIDGLVSSYGFYRLLVIMNPLGTYYVNGFPSLGQFRHVVILSPFPFIVVSAYSALLLLPFLIETHWISFRTRETGSFFPLQQFVVVPYLWIFSTIRNLLSCGENFGS